MIEQAIKGHWKDSQAQEKLISGNDECMASGIVLKMYFYVYVYIFLIVI